MYHPSCSLARKLGVKDEPLYAAEKMRGLELFTFAEQDTCCGFGGTFSVKMAENIRRDGERKVAHLMEVRPEYLIGADVELPAKHQWAITTGRAESQSDAYC